MKVSKDGLGRFVGGFDDQWYNRDDEYWEDYREKEIRYPIHNQYQASPVTTWNLNDKQN